MTVPLSLLKSEIISFTPPLPTKKTDAIKRLGAGLIEKVRIILMNPGESQWMIPAID